MLGKYRRIGFHANGTRVLDSGIATRGGINEDNFGSQHTGYSRLDDPLIPAVTVDVDFSSSPFFGNVETLINISPNDYASHIEASLYAKYQAMMNASDVESAIMVTPNAYNIDMNYMEPTTAGGNISAVEWLYLKLCGVPEMTPTQETSDVNTPAAEPGVEIYNEAIIGMDSYIRRLKTELSATTDVDKAEDIRTKIQDAESARAEAVATRDEVESSQLEFTPTEMPNTSSSPSPSTIISDTRVSNFIRSCNMFYEMVANHAYMISSVDISDILDGYYINENNAANVNIKLRLGETVDMKMTRMMHGFFDAIYDATYQREFIPDNLRKFNMTLYIHDARSFFNNTASGAMLSRILDNPKNEFNNINRLAAEHTSTMAICLMGCKFTSFIPESFNSINMTSVAPTSQESVSIGVDVDQVGITMVDAHDLIYKK